MAVERDQAAITGVQGRVHVSSARDELVQLEGKEGIFIGCMDAAAQAKDLLQVGIAPIDLQPRDLGQKLCALKQGDR